MLYIFFLVLVANFVNLTPTESSSADNEISPRAIGLFSNEVCYGELGCFRKDGDFQNLEIRPLQVLPQSPERIGTTFTLHTRIHPPVNLLPQGPFTGFSAVRDTKIIVHGFIDNDESWMPKFRRSFLALDDFNIILVDWRRGSLLPYTQATANTRVVGAQIAHLVKRLQTATGAAASSFHILGHSLGAHIAGYAGERIPNLARISGLDPAEPYFEGMPSSVRLDPSDAHFVDVIHSDADNFILSTFLGTGGLGTAQPSGHADFYPNGGFNQPGCSRPEIVWKTIENGASNLITDTKTFFGCDHLRVLDLYTESILAKSCRFTAIPCRNYQDFTSGKCANCGTGCTRMGYYAVKPENGQSLIKYYLQTSSEEPYCVNSYNIWIRLAPGQNTKRGNLSIGFRNGANATSLMPLNGRRQAFSSGRSYHFQVDNHFELQTRTNSSPVLALKWESLLYSELGLESIVVSWVTNNDLEFKRAQALRLVLRRGKILETALEAVN